MTIIGVAGTAKNTGKTTTLGALIRAALAGGAPIGVTGIGYDGEERDTVTGLPKPRIQVEPGMIVSTSASCLAHSTARGTIIARTGAVTPLGDVVLLRITAPGTVVVAGPNTAAELKNVCGRMQREGSALVFVDGSLNRIAPMVVADAVVFATGAARSLEHEVVVREMAGIEGLFGLPLTPDVPRWECGIRMSGRDTEVHLSRAMVHGEREIRRVLQWLPDGLSRIVFPGVVTADGLAVLTAGLSTGRAGVDVVLEDPLKMVLGGDPWRMWSSARQLVEAGVRLGYRLRPRLAAVTVNPAYPSFDGTIYTPAAVEGKALLDAARDRLSTFVTDILAERQEHAILERCLKPLILSPVSSPS